MPVSVQCAGDSRVRISVRIRQGSGLVSVLVSGLELVLGFRRIYHTHDTTHTHTSHFFLVSYGNQESLN